MTTNINAATSGGLTMTSDTSGILKLQTAGTDAVTIDASQNVGIGVTPSAWGSIFKAIQGTGGGSVAFRTDASNVDIFSNTYYNGTSFIYQKTGYPALRYRLEDGGTYAWFNAPSGTAGNAITFTQAMTLDASGNLGIGTSSPNAKLDILATTNTIRLGRSTSSYSTIDSNSNAGSLNLNADAGNTAGGGSMTFSFAGTERMRIDSGGNLLVGTTTAVEKLTVAGNISINTSGNPYLQIKTSGAGNNPFIRLQADTATWDIQGTFSNAGDELYLIYSGSNRGYFNSSTGAYVPVSDRNLKKDITDISYGLPAVMALRPVEYLMKTETEGSQKHLGFIAQEVQIAVPSAVSEMTDGMLGMDKTEIIAVLVKAIQEQQVIITSLTERITALEGAAQ